MQAAAVVLAGGRSTRMGRPKAWLEWHGSTLLRHVTGLVARGVDGPVVVVRAPEQPLPDLPSTVEVADDRLAERGPLHGLAVGLGALQGRADAVFVCATDSPFLHPRFVRRVVAELGDGGLGCDVVLPVVHDVRQPLAAAYRPSLAAAAARLVAADRLKLGLLLEGRPVRRLVDDELLGDRSLAEADPALESVINVNDVNDYRVARSRPAPQVTVQSLGVPGAHVRGARTVRAATVAMAAAAVGMRWDGTFLAAVNGEQTVRDGCQPLVTGDAVTFISATAGG